MRLNSIKLSGFKSFAEPTNFQLPGQLVGVVGPNGCGKSNIMDAVRWVLGESKASELRGESIVTRNYVNLGFAVSLEGGKGLIVPVVKHAEGLNLLGMARAIVDLAERARSKQLTPDEVQGGTFTITNPGSFGTFHGTPVLNQPQSGILGLHKIEKRAMVAADDAIVARPMMYLALSYDHRIIDGREAVGFLVKVKELVEEPGRILLDV